MGSHEELIYETPVESEEALLARVMARRMLNYQVLVIVCTRILCTMGGSPGDVSDVGEAKEGLENEL